MQCVLHIHQDFPLKMMIRVDKFYLLCQLLFVTSLLKAEKRVIKLLKLNLFYSHPFMAQQSNKG